MALPGTYQTPDEIIAGDPVPATSFNKYGNSIIYLASQIPVTLLTTRGDLLTRDATGMARLGIGVAGRYLRSNGTDPSWSALAASDLTFTGLTAGQYLRASGATAAAFASLQFADLAYSGLTAGQVLKATGASAASFSALAAGDIASGQLALARGGTGADLSATGGTGQVLKQTSAGGAISVAALAATDLPTATTAAKGAVQVGNDLAIASGVVNRNKGTSFPLSPTTGDLFYRTDRNLEYYYDGTRWLTTIEYGVQISPAIYTTTSGFTTTAVVLPTTYAIYFTNVVTSAKVSTTNNGSNYWSITLQSINDNFSNNDNVVSITTAAYTVNTYALTNNAPGTAAPTNRTHYRVSLAKAVGAPGGIDFACHAYYRLIG